MFRFASKHHSILSSDLLDACATSSSISSVAAVRAEKLE